MVQCSISTIKSKEQVLILILNPDCILNEMEVKVAVRNGNIWFWFLFFCFVFVPLYPKHQTIYLPCLLLFPLLQRFHSLVKQFME